MSAFVLCHPKLRDHIVLDYLHRLLCWCHLSTSSATAGSVKWVKLYFDIRNKDSQDAILFSVDLF